MPRYMTDTPQPIPNELKIPDAPKTARQVECFRSFAKETNMVEVVRRCGVPDEHQGSGIYIFLYDMADGSLVAIGTPDVKRLLYVDHIDQRGTTALLRNGYDVARCTPRLVRKARGRKDETIRVAPGEKSSGYSPIIEFDIQESGAVMNAHVKRSSGIREMDARALEWVKGFRYNERLGCGVIATQAAVTIDLR